MFDDDLDVKGKLPPKPRDLSGLSVDELKHLKQKLTDEITRIDAEIAKKTAYLDQAGAFFKS